MDQDGNVIIDSLPYVDEYTEHDAALAERLIQEEMKRGGPRPKLEEIIMFPDNPLLASALEAAAKGQKIKAIDTNRLKLELPADDAPISEWQSAVANAKSQLGHQDHRLLNLELLNKYGPNAWKLHNYFLERLSPALEQEADSLQKETVHINKRRKLDQEMHKSTLESLEMRRQELLFRILSVRDAVDRMQSAETAIH